jgi:hypothetical protein
MHLCNDAVAAGAGGRDRFVVILILAVAGAGVAVIKATSRSAAVELDTLALASDTVALASARADVGPGCAVAREGRVGRRAVGAVGQGRTAGGDWRGAEVGDELVLNVGATEAVGKLVKFAIVVVRSIQNVLGSVGRHGLGGLDLRD